MGFLAKQACVQDACRAIREVQKGKKYFAASSSRCRDRLNRQSRGNLGAGIEKTAKLTSREMEVLQLVAEGKANKETAAELAISIKTVEKHRGRLMQKLGIHDTASLTRYAVSAGVIKHSVQFNLRPQNARATACPLANSSSPARLPR
jgi:DNA-binding NarL/FixJ family response regulator